MTELQGPANPHRNRALDLFRLLFALFVLWGHAYEIPSHGDREIFAILNLPLTWGTVGVDGFFLLSGMLIVQSWVRSPRWSDYLRKRILRIVPGYAVAVVLSVVVCGLFFPGTPHFFRETFHSIRFWLSVLVLYSPLTAPAFPHSPSPLVNGSLWTITFEFRCYLLVGIMGSLGLVRRRIGWLILTAIFIVISASYSLQAALSWQKALLVVGDPKPIFRLFTVFLLGGCMALYRKEIKFAPLPALAAVLLLIGLGIFHYHHEIAYVIPGGYLLFYVASLDLPVFRLLRDMPDISYGLYLYAWPFQQIAITFLGTQHWALFFPPALFSLGAGWLSWHFVERPALKWKTGPSVELPHP